jgi:hypothetical protein
MMKDNSPVEGQTDRFGLALREDRMKMEES